MKNPPELIIYTDGSALGNPGPGGCAAVLKYGSNRKEISKGFRKTTNNRMELMGVILALEALNKEGLNFTVYSDSRYVVDAIEKKWVYSWHSKGFKGKKNPDLWLKILKLIKKQNVKFKWVESHVGIPENERCDYLAKKAAEMPSEIDEWYENNMDKQDLFD
ncbi:MAG TPA: ribonuclease H [Bacteroidia bacterium]|nr:ribonuclease HI [Sphingobacteriales bacterium]HPD64878.1 ribonuclease H [Bacteroidia bacterium]HRS58407.1 ribonuclease H [Bacteroidia bacterium]HRU67356.1 ribonuclease H [Bacteroidia bacterium]